MLLTDKVALIILFVLLGAQFVLRSFLFRYRNWIRWGIVAVILGITIYWSGYQYFYWKANELTKSFLPPYQGIGYFAYFVFTKFIGPWLIALAVSLLFEWGAKALNRRYEEQFFEAEEPALIGIGVFLSGWPGFLIYVPVVLVFGAFYTAAYNAIAKKRAPLYFLWLSFAIFAILIKNLWVPTDLLAHFNL